MSSPVSGWRRAVGRAFPSYDWAGPCGSPRQPSSASPTGSPRRTQARRSLRCSDSVLSVGHDAAPIRRDLGPLAWIVLEELALCADEGEHGELRSALGVRELASALRISKDTAARAVSRLIEVRLVRRITTRTAAGRFASCHYVLRLPRGLTLGAGGVPAAKLPPPAIKRRHAAPPRSSRGRQLTLIDHAADGDG